MPQVANFIDPKRRRQILRTVVIVIATGIVIIGIAILAINAAAQQRIQKAYATANSQAKMLDREGYYSEEQTVLEAYMATNPPKKYQYTFDIQLGDLTYMAREGKTALTWYQRAEAVNGKPGILDVSGMAQAYEMLGNKTAAIKYLREAITLTNQQTVDQSSAPSLDQAYQSQIQALGGTP